MSLLTKFSQKKKKNQKKNLLDEHDENTCNVSTFRGQTTLKIDGKLKETQVSKS